MRKIDINNEINYLLFFILAYLSYLCLGHYSATWPATANLPAAFEILDPDNIPNDFFTNASTNSPIYFFSYFLKFLSEIFSISPFKSLAIVGSVVIIFFIPSAFLFCITLLNRYHSFKVGNDKNYQSVSVLNSLFIFLIFSYVISHSQEIHKLFSILMWGPLFINPCTYVVSMLLCFFSFIFYEKNLYIMGLFLIIATLVHPITVLFFLLLISILLFEKDKIFDHVKRIGLLFILIFISIIIIKILFSSNGEILNHFEFVNIYVNERHAHHYLISSSPEIFKFFFQISLLFTLSILLFFLKQPRWINAFIFSFFFVLIYYLHFLFTEIYPNKYFAMLGFPRFYIFYFFILVIFSSILFHSFFII